MVQSDIELRIAYKCDFGGDADVIIRENSKLEFVNELDDREKESQIAWKLNSSDQVLYYLKDYGVFKISDGSTIEYHLTEKQDNSDFVELFLLNTCFPHIITQNNQFAMHGSAVKLGKLCIIVSGDSGSGKSTLSEVIIKKYGKFLSDDVVLIEDYMDKIYALPSFPCRKLCSDAAEKFGYLRSNVIPIEENDRDKVAVIASSEYSSKMKPLDAIVVLKLADVKQVEVRRITGGEILKYIIENLYEISSYGDKNIPVAVTAKIMKMAQTVPVYELSRPNGKMTVEEQMELLEKTLEV